MTLPEVEQKEFQLDVTGFQWFKHESAVKTFNADDKETLEIYYKECEE